MSMERRALIAFVASMAIFLGYDALYLQPRMKAAKERRQTELAAKMDAARDSLARVTAEPAKPDVAPALVPSGAGTEVATQADTTTIPAMPDRVIHVVSDLYDLAFSTGGGELLSAVLKGYTTGGEPVELFEQKPGWNFERAFNVTLSGDASPIPLHKVSFDAYLDGFGDALADGAVVRVAPDRDSAALVFRAKLPDGRTIERSYRFFPGRYNMEATVRVPTATFPGIHTAAWGLGPGMAATEENVKDDHDSFRASMLVGEEYHRVKPGHFSKRDADTFSGTLNWMSVQTKYFTVALFPTEPVRAETEISGSRDGTRFSCRASMPMVTRGGQTEQTVLLYLGPLEMKEMKTLGVGLERTIELGMSIIRPVSAAILWSMVQLYKVIPNYGWVILIISVLSKVLFYRLTHKSFKSMKQMQELQPKLQALKEKYKDDKQKLSQETMRIYKEGGVNPLGGCLPLVLQMPVFLALFNVLKFTIEVRGARFAGWITDLSQPDVLFHLPISLPFIGNNFSVLPILMGVSMMAQSKLGGSPTGSTTAMPAAFNTLLPVVFTVLFYSMPSGLVLYWIVNTVLSVAQQYYINKDTHPVAAVADGPAVEAAPAKKPRRSKKDR